MNSFQAPLNYTKTNRVIKALGPVKPKATPIVSKAIYIDSKISTPPMKWGQDNEENAFKNFYVYFSGRKMRYIHSKGKKNSYIATSPDGIVTCECHG